MQDYLKHKQAILLDMNSTFLFGEDRFGAEQDYSLIYHQLGGTLPSSKVNQLITACFDYLAERYSNYQQRFPSVPETLQLLASELAETEIQLLTDTFAQHERGYLSADYARALRQLQTEFRLSVVTDIWSPKQAWLTYFEEQNILHLFEAISFSSDHGHVKPSTYGFEQVLYAMQLQPHESLFIGDSAHRDLGGAKSVGMDCILVGAAQSEQALDHFPDLLAFCDAALS